MFMRHKLAALVVSLLFASLSTSAAFADDAPGTTGTSQSSASDKGADLQSAPATSGDTSSPPASKKSSGDAKQKSAGSQPHKTPRLPGSPGLKKSEAKDDASKPQTPHAPWPARLASTVVGSIVGVPVSIVRKTKSEVISATKELVDNSSNKWYLAAASPIGLCGGIVSGCFQGVVYGPYNAWKYSTDQPFAAETFSLGDSK